MSRVLILWAEPEHPNFGVRVLYEGTREILKSIDPGVEVSYQAYGEGQAPFAIGRAKGAIKRRYFSREVIPWLQSFDLVVDMRGGDSFTDIYSRTALAEQSLWSEFASQAGVPVLYGPMTVGPFNTRRGRLIAKWNLSRAAGVAVRDSVSSGFLEGIGFRADAVGTDVVFALPVPQRPNVSRHDVLLNVSGLLWNSNSHGDSASYQRLIRSLIASLLDRGRRVTLLPHDIPKGAPESDLIPSMLLSGEFDDLPVIRPEALEHVRWEVASARVSIGSRMHMCLNSISTGTPAVPLGYSRKFTPLLSDIGWFHSVDLSSAPGVNEILETVDRAESVEMEQVVNRAHELIRPVREMYKSFLQGVG